MTLGENIVRLRTQKNWSQGDLADALDISRQSVSKWETDASIPELDKLLKLSELFGVTLDELVRGEDAPKVETAAHAAQAVPASFAPQTPSEQEKRHTIVGTILLCSGAALLLACLILTGDLLAGLIYVLPFFLCGIICFTVKHRTGLWCGWAVYTCIDFYLRFATSYRTLRLPATKKEVTWLIVGWLIALVVLPLLMSYGIMPLWRDALHNYSNFSPYFFLSVLCDYVRLALVSILLVRTLAVWRLQREEKKAKN